MQKNHNVLSSFSDTLVIFKLGQDHQTGIQICKYKVWPSYCSQRHFNSPTNN